MISDPSVLSALPKKKQGLEAICTLGILLLITASSKKMRKDWKTLTRPADPEQHRDFPGDKEKKWSKVPLGKVKAFPKLLLLYNSNVPKESAYDRIDNMTKEEFLKVGNVVELSLQNMTAFTNVSLKGPFIRAKSYNGRGRMGCYSWFTVFDTLNEPFAVQRSSVI
ncbi:uncharacterized protein TNIN_356131, partial [Trichonephila inaurata madagascariensis]